MACRRLPGALGCRIRLAAGHDAVQHGDRCASRAGWRARGLRRQLGCAARDQAAIAAVGYGDGYPRHIGNGTPVLVNGQRAPIAGRVSMDMIAVDVTDLPAGDGWRPGDAVGRRIAGGGGRTVCRHDAIRIALRRQPARGAGTEADQFSKKPILTPASWITSLSRRRGPGARSPRR